MRTKKPSGKCDNNFKEALKKIYELDPLKDSDDINEWAESDCFYLAKLLRTF